MAPQSAIARQKQTISSKYPTRASSFKTIVQQRAGRSQLTLEESLQPEPIVLKQLCSKEQAVAGLLSG